MNDSPGDRPAGLGRNVGITSAFANIDLRLQRKLAINDRCRLEGFMEIFNLGNHTNLDPYKAGTVFGNLMAATFCPESATSAVIPRANYSSASGWFFKEEILAQSSDKI
jgi:hypothetical protein